MSRNDEGGESAEAFDISPELMMKLFKTSEIDNDEEFAEEQIKPKWK
jgi:hypothetical protein